MYNYETEKPKLFTDNNQRTFLKVRDNCRKLLGVAGAARMDMILSGITGDGWLRLAFVDRMVELGEIVEVPQQNCAGQYRIFINKSLI